MAVINNLLDKIGHYIARHIGTPSAASAPPPRAITERLSRHLRPCDVLLVESTPTKVSSAIKYLTQSSWSHAALYIGQALNKTSPDGELLNLIEADVETGVAAVSLSKYSGLNVRICRPIRLKETDAKRVIDEAISHIGDKYDLRNIVDLMRFLLPVPPLPYRFSRRKMLAMGSGDPSRAICSTLIAKAFETANYPILPEIERIGPEAERQEIWRIRHHSLYTPRDFDLSPYFAVIKPTIEEGFDYYCAPWEHRDQPVDCTCDHSQEMPEPKLDEVT